MNGDSVQQQMAAYFREQANQPFGDAESASGRTLAPFSRASQAAADNLLTKALRALANGDGERAQHFVDRAAALNYDDHEETAPAAFTVSMIMFEAVVDTLEECAEGDSTWLDAAIEVLPSADGWGGSELRRLLLVVRQDYMIEPGESAAIVAAVDEVSGPELRDAGLPPEDLAPAVMSVLQTVRRYQDAVENAWA